MTTYELMIYSLYANSAENVVIIQLITLIIILKFKNKNLISILLALLLFSIEYFFLFNTKAKQTL